MSVLVRVANLRVSFVTRQTRVEAVRGVSFDVRQDATLALVGESGSGKTVSAMSILRLLPENAIVDPASRIDYGGENLLAAPPSRLRALRGREISAVFQEPMSSLNPVLTVGEQVAEVLRLHRRMSARQALERAAGAASRFSPRYSMRLAGSTSAFSGSSRRIDIAETVLPLPDSPTSAAVASSRTWKLTPRTASTRVCLVTKETLKFTTLTSALIAAWDRARRAGCR